MEVHGRRLPDPVGRVGRPLGKHREAGGAARCQQQFARGEN